MRLACVDVGSTYTKGALVDDGRLVATTQCRTTLETDVREGVDACLAVLGPHDRLLACSSAGGGLRVAVWGNEELVTAEAGRRVALSSGARVVAVGSGRLGHPPEADAILLTGGTDGGDAEVLLHNARGLADQEVPVVVAGNAEVRDEAGALLGSTPHVLADNVVPRIGVLAPESARRAIRSVFLSHVIGGKGLAGLQDALLGPTPDIVLAGVEVLSRRYGDLVVVDVGGATTDVYSALVVDPEEGGLATEVVAPTALVRTVEGDLGVHWSAESTRQAAAAAGLGDVTTARAAITLALRRHAGRAVLRFGDDGKVIERSGRDLREAGLLVGSGGVLRHADPAAAVHMVREAIAPAAGGWQLPEEPRVVIDRDYVLAPLGLLALASPADADRFVDSLTSW